ncbi:MAG: hypothetical protein NC924_03190 [Candidatus Omnitrophica bacterium]|nr:hypothetical protein [Candidatus Omnitrophota bacterium]
MEQFVKKVSVAVISIVLWAAASGYAQPCAEEGGRGNQKKNKEEKECFAVMARELNLSAVQREQMTAEREKHRAQTRALLRELHEKKKKYGRNCKKPKSTGRKLTASTKR